MLSSSSEEVSGIENGSLESIFVHMTLCVDIDVPRGATVIREGCNQKGTVVRCLILLTTLGGRGVIVAPVGA